MWERPRTNGKSTSRRSRVRYAPCPVNSSTGYTQPADAGKGDLLYPVPDPTSGVEVHDSSPWNGPGVNHDRMKACHAPFMHCMSPPWCKRKLLGGPEQVYCLCRKKDDGKLMVQCKEWFHGKCVGVTARQAKRWPEYFCPDCTGQGFGQQ